MGSRVPRALALAGVAALALLLGWREIFGPDIGFQLAAGRAVLQRGFQLGDDLTWTVAGRPYLDLQWLWQVAMLGAYRALGTAGIVTLNLLLTVGAMALLVLRSIRRQGELSPWLPLWLLVFAGANLWEVRPHAASWLLLGAVLLCLERGWIWALPPLMAVWVNVHSLYVLGLAAIALHALVAIFREGRAARPLLLAAAVALLACCLNPFGPQVLLYPLRQLWEISGGSLYNRPDLGVVEFQSPWSLFEYTANGALVLLQPILFIHLGAALTVLGLLLGHRRLKVVDWLLLAGFGFLLWQAEKNFGYFAIAAGPAVIAGLWARSFSRKGTTVFAVATAAVCLILSLQIRSGWFYAQQRLPHRFGHAFNQNFLPVRACAFLNAQVPEGRLLNTWDEGGFVSFATGRKTFIDARTEVMGEQFFASYRRLLDATTFAFELPRWDPQIVLAPLAEVPEWVTHFLASSDWRLVYADEQDFVFLRQGFAPEVTALAPPPHALPEPERIDRALDRAIHLHAPGLLGTLRGPHHDPLIELRAVAAWLYRGQPAAAVTVGIEGLERTTFPAPRLLRNLVLALEGVDDLARAQRVHAALPPELQ